MARRDAATQPPGSPRPQALDQYLLDVEDTSGLSRRTAAIIVVGSILAAALLLLVAILIPGFGRVNGANVVADVGSPISVRVDNDLDIRVDMTVSSVTRATSVATAAKSRDETDIYLVRYTIAGIDSIEPNTASSLWELVGGDGTVYASSVLDLPATADCLPFDEQTGQGCTAVLVPAGADVCLVRYHGAKTFWYPGKPTAAVTWAGWEF